MSERAALRPRAGAMRVGALMVVGACSLMALAFAFTLQFGFGIEPCNLCIWERWPYAAAILLAAIGLVGRSRLCLSLAGLVLLGDAGLSAYHVAVEEGWVALPASCLAGEGARTVEELRAQLMAARPTCDQVAVTWLGLSLAAWNGLSALGLAGIALFGASRPGSSSAAPLNAASARPGPSGPASSAST